MRSRFAQIGLLATVIAVGLVGSCGVAHVSRDRRAAAIARVCADPNWIGRPAAELETALAPLGLVVRGTGCTGAGCAGGRTEELDASISPTRHSACSVRLDGVGALVVSARPRQWGTLDHYLNRGAYPRRSIVARLLLPLVP